MSAVEPPIVTAATPPRRLDPRTILVRFVQGSPSVILAMSVFLVGSRGEGALTGALLPGAALLLVVILVINWLRWRAFTYQILPSQIVITRGLIKRTRRSIPAERIQDVSIKQGPLSRLVGLAEVRIETGGGEADEGILDSVSLPEAYRLREVLRDIRMGERLARTDGRPSQGAAETTLFRMGFLRLLYSGLFRFSLVWIVALFGTLQYLDHALGYDEDRWLEWVGVAERELQSRLDSRVVLTVAGLAFVLGFLAGIIRTVLQNFGFRLTHSEARFRYRRGLLTRTEVVVAKRQIQIGLVERGAVSGRLGWAAFKVQTLAGSDHASGRQELAPFARQRELAPIIALAGLPPFERSQLRSVSPWHIVRGLVGLVIPTSLILLAAAMFQPLAALLLFALPAPLAVMLLRRRYHRYALAETSIQVSRGVLTRREWTVPYGNVQVVTVRRGPIQRLLGIATVRIDTAGGRGINGPHVHDIDEENAATVVGDLIGRMKASGSNTHQDAR